MVFNILKDFKELRRINKCTQHRKHRPSVVSVGIYYKNKKKNKTTVSLMKHYQHNVILSTDCRDNKHIMFSANIF